MRRTLLVLTAGVALFAASDTAFAHKKKVVVKNVHKVVHKNVHKTVFKSVHHTFAPVTPGFSISSGSFGVRVVLGPTLPYRYVVRRVWVPAVTRLVLVGYDACGVPIYRRIVVRPGTYRSARYKVYVGGPEVFVAYLN